MEISEAKILIENLIGRLEPHGDRYKLPDGIISNSEVGALRALAWDRDVASPPATESGREYMGGSEQYLDCAAFEGYGPPEEELRICLDFGTAMSKAWASRHHDDDSIPLMLRQSSRRSDLAVPSVIFISNGGRIYFGSEAETQHRQDIGRPCFDNIKRILTDAEIGQELDDVALPEGVDPTASGLAKGDLLVLYLAWLTDLAVSALCEHEQRLGEGNAERLRYVRRRFAIPCFESAEDESRGSERAEWAQGVLERSLLRAQVVADTLSGGWNGLTTKRAYSVLVKCRDEVSVEDLSHLLAKAAPVREPVAAGASRFNEKIEETDDLENKLIRRALLVIDAGAGTTDFALFQVFQRSSNVRYALIGPSIRMCAVAGNAVDEILISIVLEKCGINPESGHPRSPDDFAFAKSNLRSEIRDIKRDLFQQDHRQIALRPNVSGTIHVRSVLENEQYIQRSRELVQIRDEMIKSMFGKVEWPRRDEIPVYVLLTGGSSTLPLMRDLSKGSVLVSGVKLVFRSVDSIPEWVDSLPRESSELLGEVFPQCAVAIGGSARELPREVQDLDQLVTPAPSGPRVLERYAVRGDSK